MATRTWMHGLWLGVVGFSLAAGCVVKSGDDDEGSAGEGGDTGGSSTGGKGGSSTGGKGGSSTGGKGGSATGGSAGSGTGGATGGSSGSGTGGTTSAPTCDPDQGELVNTPYPDCEPRDADDDCEVCIQEECCEFSQVCYGFNPNNVCGWGGPTSGTYMDLNEWDCYRICAEDYFVENGVYDSNAADFDCFSRCVTPQCGTILGNATQDMIICADTNCEDECFATPDT